MEFQVRSETDGLSIHPTLESAINHANRNPTIWKISFSLPNGERVRLIKIGNDSIGYNWAYSPILRGNLKEEIERESRKLKE